MNEEGAAGSADEFANKIQNLLDNHFPNSTGFASYSDRRGESIAIKFAIGQKKDWSNGIIQNSPVQYGAMIFGIKNGMVTDKMSLESSVGASITTKPPTNSYLAYGRVKVATRKTTGNEAKLLKAIEKVLVTLKTQTKKNLGNMTDQHQWVKNYI